MIGSWAEAAIQMEIAAAGTYEVRVTAPDPDGNRVTFSSPADSASAGLSGKMAVIRAPALPERLACCATAEVTDSTVVPIQPGLVTG